MATHALPASRSIIDDDDAPQAAALAPSRQPAVRPGLMRRLYDAVLEAQQRRARREIARVLGPGALERAFRVELPPER